MPDELEALLAAMPRYWDCRIVAFDGDQLLILGGTTGYATALQQVIRFAGVVYLACPTDFHHPRFRLAKPREMATLAKIVDLDGCRCVAVDAESSGKRSESQPFFIVAREVHPLSADEEPT